MSKSVFLLGLEKLISLYFIKLSVSFSYSYWCICKSSTLLTNNFLKSSRVLWDKVNSRMRFWFFKTHLSLHHLMLLHHQLQLLPEPIKPNPVTVGDTEVVVPTISRRSAAVSTVYSKVIFQRIFSQVFTSWKLLMKLTFCIELSN